MLGFLGVLLGAFGTHYLQNRLSASALAIWHTAIEYHLVHALAMVLAAVLFGIWGASRLRTAALLFGFGIVVFSGSLYLLAVTDQKWLGAVTPLGGLCFLTGWGHLAVGSGNPKSKI